MSFYPPHTKFSALFGMHAQRLGEINQYCRGFAGVGKCPPPPLLFLPIAFLTRRRMVAAFRPSRALLESSAKHTRRYSDRLTRSKALKLLVTTSNTYDPGNFSVVSCRISATSCVWNYFRVQGARGMKAKEEGGGSRLSSGKL